MENNAVQSLQRAFALLEVLAEHPKGMALVEMVGKTGLNKSTIHRILSNLAQMGYVSQDEFSRQYRLTVKLFEVGSNVIQGMDIISFSKPHLFELSRSLGEVVNLAVPNNNDVLYVYIEESGKNAVRVTTYAGARNPMYCTACGKAILAEYSNAEIYKIWQQSEIVQHTPATITDFSKLMEEINWIRAHGYALDREEYELGVWCAAVSVVDYSGSVWGAVSVTAPLMRADDELQSRVIREILVAREKLCACFGNTQR